MQCGFNGQVGRNLERQPWDVLTHLCLSVEDGVYPKRMLLENSVRRGFCHTPCRTFMVCEH